MHAGLLASHRILLHAEIFMGKTILWAERKRSWATKLLIAIRTHPPLVALSFSHLLAEISFLEWKWLQSSISLVWWNGNKHLAASSSFQNSFCHYCPFQFRRVKSYVINWVRFPLNLQSIFAFQVTILSKFYMLSLIFFLFLTSFFLSFFHFSFSFSFFHSGNKLFFDW